MSTYNISYFCILTLYLEESYFTYNCAYSFLDFDPIFYNSELVMLPIKSKVLPENKIINFVIFMKIKCPVVHAFS